MVQQTSGEIKPRSHTPKRPLLRGILVNLGQWYDSQDRPGEQTRAATIAVWCPFCAAYHYHSWQPEDNGRVASHRVAHCSSPDSPFFQTGYFISVVCRGQPGYTEHVIKPGTRLARKTSARA